MIIRLGNCNNCNNKGKFLIGYDKKYCSCNDCLLIIQDKMLNDELDEGKIMVNNYSVCQNTYTISYFKNLIKGNIANPIPYYRSYIKIHDSSFSIRMECKYLDKLYFIFVKIEDLAKYNNTVPCPKLIIDNSNLKKQLKYIQTYLVKTCISNNKILQFVKKTHLKSSLSVLPEEILNKITYDYYN